MSATINFKLYQQLLATQAATEAIAKITASRRHPVASEWGGYGSSADVEVRTNSIRDFKCELRQRPIAGDVYTQATNIEDERNGLIGFHLGELEVPAGLLHSREG